MKTLFRIMTIFLMLFCFAGCDDDKEEVLSTLDVTAANLNGTWKLVEWNGAPLQAGSYCYITFSRKDKTYKMYDKFDSMYPNLKTGSFEIEKEKNLGYIISGDYDFGNGEWANSSYRNRPFGHFHDLDYKRYPIQIYKNLNAAIGYLKK